MEAYLRRCLNSVTRDDVPDSLELIVVNDGSTDKSLSIMQEYATKRPDIVTIINKPNGHYGSCVNAALKVATGKYFRILDADDWFDTDGLIEFLNKLNKIDIDLIVTCFKIISRSGIDAVSNDDFAMSKPYQITDKYITNHTKLNTFCMHSMTFKTDLLKRTAIPLQEGICYTDNEFVIYPFAKVQNICFFNIFIYNYDLMRESQSMDSSVIQKNRNHLYLILLRMLKHYDAISTPHTQKILFNILVRYYYLILFLSPKSHEDDQKLAEIDILLSRNCAPLRRKLYIKLYGSPIVWKIFKNRFLFYEKIKHTFRASL